jgi:hypothetical protein
MRVDGPHAVRMHELPPPIFQLRVHRITDRSVFQNQRWVGSSVHKGAHMLSYVHAMLSIDTSFIYYVPRD